MTEDNENHDSDQAFFDAVDDIGENNKIDFKVFLYILKQKDELIQELRERVQILNNEIDILKIIIPNQENSIETKIRTIKV